MRLVSPRVLEFDRPLLQGVILSRPNRFIMKVELEGKEFDCHCPATGKILDIDFNQSTRIPCLLSEPISAVKRSAKKPRLTSYTVEAISLDSVLSEQKSFIGINQVRVNSFFEHFLRANEFSSFLPECNGENVRREVPLGQSRLDFLIGNTYVELKTPLLLHQLKAEIPPHIPLLSSPLGPSTKGKRKTAIQSPRLDTDRLTKHFTELANSLNEKEDKRAAAVVCLVYMYDAGPFQVPPNPDPKIVEAVSRALERGVRQYQVNMEITPTQLKILDFFPLHIFSKPSL